jgi:hypothetical protein
MLDYKNAKRILDGYIEDTRGVTFSAYTSLSRGETRHGGGKDWKDGKRIRTRVPARDRVKIARNTWLERFTPERIERQSRARLYSEPGSFNAIGRLADYPENAIGVRLHETYIVIHTPHWTELNTGGWATMTTRERMESFSQVQIGASRSGWAVYLQSDKVECYCVRNSFNRTPLPDRSGIVIRGEYAHGLDLKWTGEYDPDTPSANDNGAPIYEFVTCSNCDGAGVRSGFDFDSGGHPYFDGIRVSPDGKRLMRSQPNRAETFEPVRTISGITGESLGRWRSTYYGGYAA